MSQSYTFEPELLKPAPREVRARPGTKKKFAKGCSGCFLVPHTLVGIGLIVWLLWSALLTVAGQSVPATITGRHTGSGEDGPTYHLWYSYSAGGVTYEKKASVSYSTYSSYPNGSVVTAKISRLAPGVGAQLHVAGNRSAMPFLFFVPFTLFWNGMLLGVWWGVLGKGGGKGLVRAGIPAVGRILHKRIVTGSYGDSHYILYEWLPPGAMPVASQSAARPASSGPFATSSLSMPGASQPSAVQTRASFDAGSFVRVVSPTVTVDFKPFPLDSDDDNDNDATPSGPNSAKSWRAVIAEAKAKAEQEKQRIAARHTPGAQSREDGVELLQWNAVRVGELVTVLVDRRKPSRAVIYRIAGWEAV